MLLSSLRVAPRLLLLLLLFPLVVIFTIRLLPELKDRAHAEEGTGALTLDAGLWFPDYKQGTDAVSF